MAHATIVPLTGIVLPENGALQRSLTWPDAPEEFRRKYDYHTLIYDSIWRDDLQRHVLSAPSFFNLWPPFRSGLAATSGSVTVTRRKRGKRSEQIFLKGPRDGITVTIDGRSWRLNSRASEVDRFAGLRCGMTLNKNNELKWVYDWAYYHVHRHGMEAVALVDNGSDAYSLEELRETLASVEGLKEAVIYSAPYPYGPPGRGGKRFPLPKFFQSAMLNMARRDVLAKARSVLNCDIDEIVTGVAGESIFEAAERSSLGMITFYGYWAYPEDMASAPSPQLAHTYRIHPIAKVNRKWCIVPGRFIDRHFDWDVHQTGGIFQNLFTVSRRFEHAHCRACTTGWRPGRFTVGGQRMLDDALARELRCHLPAPTSD